MKILLVTDGSNFSETAIDACREIVVAPESTSFKIISAVEFPTMLPSDPFIGASADYYDQIETAGHSLAKEFVEKSADHLRLLFSGYTLDLATEVLDGSPQRVIVEKAESWGTDLIVIGSHGRSGAGRFILGSVSLKVLSEAACSVRVARRSPARAENDDSPLRIVIGFDGSPDSLNAVESVMSREWLPDTAVRLISAVESLPYSVLLAEMPKVNELRESAAAKLKEKGLHVSTVIQFGRAKNLIIEEAEKWGADSIYIGAKGHRWMERVMLGSVSYSVAARAACSVEVVR